MAEGRPPLMDMHPLRALLQIPKRPPPRLNPNGNWSDKLVSFLEVCLVKDPDKRATAQELLQHPFIRSAGKRQIIRNYLEKQMPAIKTYRKEKNWKTETGTAGNGGTGFEDMNQVQEDDNDLNETKIDESKTNSNSNSNNKNKNNNNNNDSQGTMVVKENAQNKHKYQVNNGGKDTSDSKNNGNNSNLNSGNYDYGRSLINPNRKPLNELNERTPEYIVRPLFEERTPIFHEFVSGLFLYIVLVIFLILLFVFVFCYCASCVCVCVTL